MQGTSKDDVPGGTKPVTVGETTAYYIGRYEVTVAEFRAFTVAKNYAFDWTANKPYYDWQDNFPMTNVTWYDAQAFCKWAGSDLPTAKQWEKAARGVDARQHPWGDTWNDAYANVGKKLTRPAPVGSYPSGISPYGCYDMVGNVAEWCFDASGTTGKIVKSSDYYDANSGRHVASTYTFSPGYRSVFIGFRLWMAKSP